MDSISAVIAFAVEVFGLVTAFYAYYKKTKKQMDKIAEGTKCQLRSEMLRIYYHNREDKKIRQYEFENFVKLYEAYKALDGNSFIDKIYDEIKEWEVVS